MGLTVDRVAPGDELWGRKRVVLLQVDFDASYPTGGEPLNLALYGIKKADAVFAESKGGYVFEYDYAAGKLKAMWGDNNNAADGPLVEVVDTTNLATVTNVRVLVIGE